MIFVLRIIFILQFCLGFKLNALLSASDICSYKGKIHSIIIGGIRAPGHWLYPSVDKVYDEDDKHVLIINDLSMTNPDVQIEVQNSTLPVLEEKLACLKGSVKQILFEHVGYGLHEKHFDHVIQFLVSLLKPEGKIVYTSYRVPFSYSDSQTRQRKKYLPIGPNLCQLLGIPEPKIVYKFRPHKITSKGYYLENELKSLNHHIHQKVQTLLEMNSCYNIENDPEILKLMKVAKSIFNHSSFPYSIKSWAPIELYLPFHEKIINCNSDLPHGIAVCDITRQWWPFHLQNSPCSQMLEIFKNSGLVIKSIAVEHTDDVFAFKITVQKH